jgi:hypothetical protein
VFDIVVGSGDDESVGGDYENNLSFGTGKGDFISSHHVLSA